MLMNSFLHHVEVGVGRKGSVKGILPDVMVVIESLKHLVTFGNRGVYNLVDRRRRTRSSGHLGRRENAT